MLSSESSGKPRAATLLEFTEHPGLKRISFPAARVPAAQRCPLNLARIDPSTLALSDRKAEGRVGFSARRASVGEADQITPAPSGAAGRAGEATSLANPVL